MNHYAILNLPSPTSHSSTPVTSASIKQAYHTALLKHHPDKLQSPSADPPPSIDVIKLAYSTLSDPAQRAAHDRALLLRKPSWAHTSNNGASTTRSAGASSGSSTSTSSNGQSTGESSTSSSSASTSFHTGSEQLDLDDMQYAESDDGRATWSHGCRCGDSRGFVLTEAQLEAEEARGGREVVVGCAGCSLWVRVAFGVVEAEAGEIPAAAPVSKKSAG
jgi:diphthamide biosynthesis protein 4